MTRDERTALEVKRINSIAASASDLIAVALEHSILASTAPSIDDALAHRSIAQSTTTAALRAMETI